jgi:hypothetical protein
VVEVAAVPGMKIQELLQENPTTVTQVPPVQSTVATDKIKVVMAVVQAVAVVAKMAE